MNISGEACVDDVDVADCIEVVEERNNGLSREVMEEERDCWC